MSITENSLHEILGVPLCLDTGHKAIPKAVLDAAEIAEMILKAVTPQCQMVDKDPS